MPLQVNSYKASHASGEVTPNIRAATDLLRFQTGAEKLENLVVLPEAIIARSPGTRFVLELKDESQRGKMMRFLYSGSDYYSLCFNGGAMRVIKDGGFLQVLGAPFELAVPWIEADMEKLRTSASGNVLLQVAAGKPPQKLTRNDHTDWTIERFRPTNGPVDAQNLDTAKTILASAVDGAINLVGTGDVFTPGQVDGVFRLNEASQSFVKLWKASETIALPTDTPPAGIGYFGSMTSPENAFDADFGSSASEIAVLESFIGRSYGTATAVSAAEVTVLSPGVGDGGAVTLKLYGKDGAAPADATECVLLAQVTYPVDSEGAAAHTLLSEDIAATWGHLAIGIEYNGAALDFAVAEIVFTRSTPGSPPVLRRWQQNIYQAIVAGNSGLTAPIHTEGDFSSGEGNVTWRFLNPGYGYVQITAVTDANTAAGTVLARLPESVTTNATYRWWPPGWCEDMDWPSNVAAHDQRFLFQRGNEYWMTKPFTIDDFELTVEDDGAIARRLVAEDGSYVDLRAAISCGVLVQLARDQGWLTRAPGNFDAITPVSIRDVPDDNDAAAAEHIPARVSKGCIFIDDSRRRLYYISFEKLTEELKPREITAACRHIFEAQAMRVVFQDKPHNIAWIALADGTLASITFIPEEKIIAAARHPRANCFVEDLLAIKSAVTLETDIYLQTRREINGQTRRYYEQLAPFFKPLNAAAPTAEGAWFLDCALRYQGAPTSRLTGLFHLIGEAVRILANGVQIDGKTVDALGGVDLDGDVTDAIVGLPIAWKYRDLPRSIALQGQNAKGAPLTAHHVGIDVINSAGGMVSVNDGIANALTETGAADYNAPLALFTGLQRVSLASALKDEIALEISGDNALPFTMAANTLLTEIEERA